MLFVSGIAFATTFTEMAGSGAEGDGTRGKGIGVADLDGDGRRDLVVLGHRYSGEGAKLLLQGSTPLTFIDETSALAPVFGNRGWDRQVLVADLDNDAQRDLVFVASDFVGVFLQNDDGTFGTTSPVMGGANYELMAEDDAVVLEPGHPHQVPGLNFEGVSAFDPDGDGRLDLQAAWKFIRIQDPGSPSTASFSYGPDGLDSSYLHDDYLLMDDFDGDGQIDLVAGRGSSGGSPVDLFWGDAGGWSPANSPNFQGYGVKGSFAICDFDSDGNLDIFRTVAGDPNLPSTSGNANQVWIYDAVSRTYGSIGDPGVDVSRGTWATACGDIDNDLDVDLVVAYDDGGLEIFRNLGGGAWAADNGGVVAGAVHGLALVDLDEDGDLDLYLNQSGANALWRNDLDDQRFLSVEVLANVGSCEAPILRDDHHARVRVKDWLTNVESPVHVVRDAMGTGTGTAGPIHVGLGSMDPLGYYRVSVQPYAVQPDGSAPWSGWASAHIPALGPDHLVTVRTDDLDGDGISNTVEGNVDTDGDGEPNFTDWDSDGDDIWDAAEAGPDPCSPIDTDGDGAEDYLDTDSDGDGYDDDVDCDRLDPNLTTAVNWYVDDDLDGFGAGPSTSACEAPSGMVRASGDCDDADSAIHPNADEMCDSVDRNCDGNDTLGAADALMGWLDADEDGFGTDDVSVEACVLPFGYVIDGGDCDDAEPGAFPGGFEVCDGLDNDCDGTVDGADADGVSSFYNDSDNDGFGSGSPVLACSAPANHRDNNTDCDDSNGSVFPGASEQCNEVDDNCDGGIDEGVIDVPWYVDEDGDNHGDGSIAAIFDCQQPLGRVLLVGDCNDADPAINPLAPETCDGVDSNCSGNESDATDATTWYTDIDLDGWGLINSGIQACEAPFATATQAGDCDDTSNLVSPDQVEICDGIDNDCTLLVDDNAIDAILIYADLDGDGHGNPDVVAAGCGATAGWVPLDDDCDDAEPLAWFDAVELCDGVDNDCNGLLDADDPDLPPGSASTWFEDLDMDGYGAGTGLEICTPPDDRVLDSSDCDDTSAAVNPGATEILDNAVDEDCDGEVGTAFADADGDGLEDALELPGDFDGDGIANINDPDSDGDGVWDGAEPSLEAVTNAGDVEGSGAPTLSIGCQSVGTSPLPWLGLPWFATRQR